MESTCVCDLTYIPLDGAEHACNADSETHAAEMGRSSAAWHMA